MGGPYSGAGDDGGGDDPPAVQTVSISLRTVAGHRYVLENAPASTRHELKRDSKGRVRSLRASGSGFVLKLDSTLLPGLYTGSVTLEDPKSKRRATGSFVGLSNGKKWDEIKGPWVGGDSGRPGLGNVTIKIGNG